MTEVINNDQPKQYIGMYSPNGCRAINQKKINLYFSDLIDMAATKKAQDDKDKKFTISPEGWAD